MDTACLPSFGQRSGASCTSGTHGSAQRDGLVTRPAAVTGCRVPSVPRCARGTTGKGAYAGPPRPAVLRLPSVSGSQGVVQRSGSARRKQEREPEQTKPGQRQWKAQGDMRLASGKRGIETKQVRLAKRDTGPRLHAGKLVWGGWRARLSRPHERGSARRPIIGVLCQIPCGIAATTLGAREGDAGTLAKMPCLATMEDIVRCLGNKRGAGQVR